MNAALLSVVALGLLGGTDDGAAKAVVAKRAEPAPRVAVVELFTSEGCSSCPPADELLGTLEERAKLMNRGKDGKVIEGQHPVIVFPLAFHVDYWDRLGWPDRFASPQFTARQERYVEALKSRSLYTPQAVVNGDRDIVANQERPLLEAIRTAKVARVNVDVKLATRKPGEAIVVEVKLSPASGTLAKTLTVNAALSESNIVTDVKRGENAGRKLSHSHVVRALATDLYDAAAGETLKLTLGVPKDAVESNSQVVVWVQDKGVREVLGASAVAVEAPAKAEEASVQPAGEKKPIAEPKR